MNKMNKTIDITLVKSLIGRLPKHIQIAKQLGLTKINSKVVQPNTPAVLGMVRMIDYMVEFKESV